MSVVHFLSLTVGISSKAFDFSQQSVSILLQLKRISAKKIMNRIGWKFESAQLDLHYSFLFLKFQDFLPEVLLESFGVKPSKESHFGLHKKVWILIQQSSVWQFNPKLLFMKAKHVAKIMGFLNAGKINNSAKILRNS